MATRKETDTSWVKGEAPDVAASTGSAASDDYGICEHGRPKHSRCVDCENEKEPGELAPAQCSAIDEARALALLNAIKCCEHVLRRIGAPENTIARFQDGDYGHVIWWIDTQSVGLKPINEDVGD